MSFITALAMGEVPEEPENVFDVNKSYLEHKGKYRAALQESYDVISQANVVLINRLTGDMKKVVDL